LCGKGEPGAGRKKAGPGVEQRGAELGVDQGSSDSSNYLTPIRAVPGAVFTSTDWGR